MEKEAKYNVEDMPREAQLEIELKQYKLAYETLRSATNSYLNEYYNNFECVDEQVLVRALVEAQEYAPKK